MATLVMLKAMVKRYRIELQRYYLNTASLVVSLYFLFVAIFFGGQSLAGGPAEFGGTAEGLVVGFMIWFLAVFAYSEMAFSLMTEAQQGTLEQLAMSPLGLKRVLLGRLGGALLFQLGVTAVLLLLLMTTTSRWLNLDPVSIVPLLLITITSVLGIGFIMGGLALVFKRIQETFQILQFVFVGLIAAPIESVPLLKFLPLSWGTELISRVMIGGQSIAQMPVGALLFLVGNSAVYFALGLLVFSYFENVARDRGLLGHY